MPDNFITVPVPFPGALGLNKQTSGEVVDIGWATEANNCVIDESGLLASRKGSKNLNTTAITSSPNVKSIYEYIDASGTKAIILAAGNKLYRVNGAALVDITGTITTPTGDNWKFQNFNGKCIGVQTGHKPIVLSSVAGSFADISFTSYVNSTAIVSGGTSGTYVVNDVLTVSGGTSTTAAQLTVTAVSGGLVTAVSITQPGVYTVEPSNPVSVTGGGGGGAQFNLSWYGDNRPSTSTNEVLSAFGRVWYLDGRTLKYSDSLLEGRCEGVFDLHTVLLKGADTPIALAEFNGYLVILCENSVIVYQDAWTPSSMTIVENIGGVGCIARDSVQHIGTDLLFLSAKGVVSLGRVIQEKSMPMSSPTKNVRDYFISKVLQETKANIKSAFNTTYEYYIISLPAVSTIIYVDCRQLLEDGSFRCTEWSIAKTATFASSTGELYFGTAGYIQKYTGYKDNVIAAGTGGTAYVMEYTSGWTGLGGELEAIYKVFKNASIYFFGTSGQNLSFKWRVDHTGIINTKDVTTPPATVYRWSTSFWSLGRWSGVASQYLKGKVPIFKSGKIIKFGISSSINDNGVAIQRIELGLKVGRRSL